MTAKADEMKERRALSGSNSAMTFHSRAVADLQLEGQSGRFTDKAMVSGSEPAVRYPAAASWVGADVAVEPPLGYSVHDMLPTGEVAEISASLNAIEALHLPSVALVALPAAPTPAPQSPGVVERGSATIPTALATSSPPVRASVSSLPLLGNDVAATHIKRRKVVG